MAGRPRCKGLQHDHQHARAEALDGGHYGLRQFVQGRGRGPLVDGQVHLMLGRRGPRDRRFRQPTHRHVEARDEVRVVCWAAWHPVVFLKSGTRPTNVVLRNSMSNVFNVQYLHYNHCASMPYGHLLAHWAPARWVGVP